MATYNITKSDGSAGPAIADAASPDTQTDLQLVGQNAVSYGLDVAQSFYFLLENFSKNAPPTNGDVVGQLWFDKDAGAGAAGPNAVLNLWNGSNWKPLASTAIGTSADSMSRWDNSAKTWTEETQVTLTAGGVLTILDLGLTDSVAFSHDGTDFNIAGTGTTDINVTGITAMNIPSITLTTVLDETYGGTGQILYAVGDIMYADTTTSLTKLVVGANGEVLTLAAGVPGWASGGGAGTVTSSGSPLNNEVAVFATGTDINSDSTFTWDGTTMFATNVTGTNIGGIASANLIDRTSPGIIIGSPTFTATVVMESNITFRDGDWILMGTGDDVAFEFDGDDLNIMGGVAAIDLNITGFSGAFKSQSPGHFGLLNETGGGVRVIGDTSSDSTNNGFFSVYHNDQGQEQVRLGTGAGSTFSEVRALTADLNLYASNTLVFNLNSTETTATAGGATAMTLHAVSGTNTSSTIGVYDDGGAERNVGYNETPEVLVSGAVTVDANDIGKFLRRSALTSRVITLSADTDIPVGGSLLVHNDHTTGTLTIATTQTLEWVDGSGSAPSTGTRTLAYNGIATVRKKSSTVWQIWGNGIS